uniref:helix-turn-helix transcriptional regulator n=1 Tax=Ndongobacter massiliensis TaxID=1871025 RepID=UPI002F911AC3
MTQARLAKEIETSVSYVNRVIRSKETIVNNTLVKMMEALGYDIKLRYVRREEELWHKANIISITY